MYRKTNANNNIKKAGARDSGKTQMKLRPIKTNEASMKVTKNQIKSKQDRYSKLRKALRKIKQLLKYRTNLLSSISDHDTIVFYLRQCDDLNRQRISLERQLRGVA